MSQPPTHNKPYNYVPPSPAPTCANSQPSSSPSNAQPVSGTTSNPQAGLITSNLQHGMHLPAHLFTGQMQYFPTVSDPIHPLPSYQTSSTDPFTFSPSPYQPPQARSPSPTPTINYIDDMDLSMYQANIESPPRLLSPSPSSSLESQQLSTISITVRTPITINGSHNTFFFTPSDLASAMSEGVLDALRKSSIGGFGIPMIDEEGRPRPVDLVVDAMVRVEGDGNIIGGSNSDTAATGVPLENFMDYEVESGSMTSPEVDNAEGGFTQQEHSGLGFKITPSSKMSAEDSTPHEGPFQELDNPPSIKSNPALAQSHAFGFNFHDVKSSKRSWKEEDDEEYSDDDDGGGGVVGTPSMVAAGAKRMKTAAHSVAGAPTEQLGIQGQQSKEATTHAAIGEGNDANFHGGLVVKTSPP